MRENHSRIGECSRDESDQKYIINTYEIVKSMLKDSV